MPAMASTDRAYDRGTRAGFGHLAAAAAELREQRRSLGLSQEHVAAAARLSRSRYSRMETGSIRSLTILELDRLAAVLGLEAAVRLYPGGVPVRDAAHAGKLRDLLRLAAPPLTYRIEVPLPATAGSHRDGWERHRGERRAWDAVLVGHQKRTAIELEMRLRDVQAMRRRVDLKRRDDPTERFLLLIADTRNNRNVLREFAPLFEDLPRVRPSVVRAALAAGTHPPTGSLLV
jgi:transcriptional regulator with XRE-family HTH domain